eukprot:TRINITY_DN723_c0_g1_i1.p1 TRINITY_DN723_c0_g1~~TRINITY_DN723_c0_g1_i1.p1  ORF type:complete len:111 (-),score=11.41 TRINITY_DN723_c0_g1_i1:57-389(-)
MWIDPGEVIVKTSWVYGKGIANEEVIFCADKFAVETKPPISPSKFVPRTFPIVAKSVSYQPTFSPLSVDWSRQDPLQYRSFNSHFDSWGYSSGVKQNDVNLDSKSVPIQA